MLQYAYVLEISVIRRAWWWFLQTEST